MNKPPVWKGARALARVPVVVGLPVAEGVEGETEAIGGSCCWADTRRAPAEAAAEMITFCCTIVFLFSRDH